MLRNAVPVLIDRPDLGGRHLRGTAARHHPDIGEAADHGDALGALEQRQHAVILQQHGSGGGFGAGGGLAARHIKRGLLRRSSNRPVAIMERRMRRFMSVTRVV